MSVIDQLDQSAVSLKNEILKLRNEINELAKEKRRQEIMDFSSDVYNNEFYDLSKDDKKILSQLPIEHKEIVDQKQNEIAELQLEYDNVLNEVQLALKSIEAINDEGANHEMQTYDMSVESDLYNIQAEFYKKQSDALEQYIKDFTTFNVNLNGQINSTYKALKHQIDLSKDIDSRGGGINDIENDIKNISAHFKTINSELTTVNQQFAKIEEQHAEDQSKHIEAMKKSKELYGFQEASEMIKQEIEEVKKAITVNFQNLNQIEQRIITGTERYKLLKSIPFNQIAQDVSSRLTIQTLSRKLIQLREKKKEQQTQLTSELAQIREENSKLESRIEITKKILDNSQIILQPTKAILKQQIKEKKNQTGDREIKTIQKINQTKLKVPRRSGIPLPKRHN